MNGLGFGGKWGNGVFIEENWVRMGKYKAEQFKKPYRREWPERYLGMKRVGYGRITEGSLK